MLSTLNGEQLESFHENNTNRARSFFFLKKNYAVTCVFLFSFDCRSYYYCYSPDHLQGTHTFPAKARRLCHVRYPNSFSHFHDFSSTSLFFFFSHSRWTLFPFLGVWHIRSLSPYPPHQLVIFTHTHSNSRDRHFVFLSVSLCVCVLEREKRGSLTVPVVFRLSVSTLYERFVGTGQELLGQLCSFFLSSEHHPPISFSF